MAIVIGFITILISIISYSLYIKDTLKGKTKPHGMTWLIWAFLNGFIFFQQMTHDAGPGSWVTASAAVACLTIFILSFRYGEKNITHLDWLCLVLVTAMFGYWFANPDPIIAVLLAVIVFLLGLLPTIRKSYRRAAEETIATYALNGVKFFIALFALSTIDVVTVAYPLTLFVVNISFAGYLLYSRKYVKQTKRKRKNI